MLIKNDKYSPLISIITVSFNSEEDLLEKIHFYLKHEELIADIAIAGYKKALELLESNVFFNTLFESDQK